MGPVVNSLIDLVRSAQFNHPDLASLQTFVEQRGATLATRPASERTRAEQIEYLKCLCVASEVHDYFGRYDDAGSTIATEFPRALAFMRDRRSLRGDEKKLFKQVVWLVVHQAHVEYRKSRHDAARQLLGECEEALNRQLVIEDEEASPGGQPAYDIRCRVAYSQARVERQLQNLEEARGLYAAAIEFQYRRMESVLRSNKTQAEKDHEQRCSNYMIAKALGLGLGWISLKSGQLKRAHATIAAARALIHSTGDVILKGYADLLFAQALRARAGTNATALGQPIKILKGLVHGPLKNHDQYRTRAQIELARAYHLLSCSPQLRETEPAAEALSMAKETLARLQAEAKAHPSWTIFAKVLMSRILCREARKEKDNSRQADLLTEAARGAMEAFDEARNTGEKAFQVQSLMAQADVLLETAKTIGDDAAVLAAEEKLRKALELARESPLDKAVCHLCLARVALRRGFASIASREFDLWLDCKGQIEHGFALELAAEVEDEILRSRDVDFVFRERGGLNYNDLHDRLRRWLIERAHAKLGEDFANSLHNELGIAYQTGYNWRKELNCYPPESKKEGRRANGGSKGSGPS
jgi:hypothetical protein